jgi:hypothetical protein
VSVADIKDAPRLTTSPFRTSGYEAADSFVGEWVRVSGTCGAKFQKLSFAGADLIWEYSSSGLTWIKHSASGPPTVTSGVLSLKGKAVLSKSGEKLKRLNCGSGEASYVRATDADFADELVPKLMGTWSPAASCSLQNTQRLTKSGSTILWEFRVPGGSTTWSRDTKSGPYSFDRASKTLTLGGDKWKLTTSGVTWGGCAFQRAS